MWKSISPHFAHQSWAQCTPLVLCWSHDASSVTVDQLPSNFSPFILCSYSSLVTLYFLFESGGSSTGSKWCGVYGTDRATQGIAGDNSTWTSSSHSRACRGCEPPSWAPPSIICTFSLYWWEHHVARCFECIFAIISGGCILCLYSFVSMIWISFLESFAIQIFFVLILLFQLKFLVMDLYI